MLCSRRTALGCLLIALPAWATVTPERRRIYLQPLGASLPNADLSLVRAALRAFYDFDFRMLRQASLPKVAFYPPRQRYRAEKLLAFLGERRPSDGRCIVGLTHVDISTTKPPHADWGILGLATMDGPACVLSNFRTRRGATSPEHARIRFAKTAVHEVGHTLGLAHCSGGSCLMQDGRGTVATTDAGYDLCTDCRRELQRRGHPLTSGHVPAPWPRPE